MKLYTRIETPSPVAQARALQVFNDLAARVRPVLEDYRNDLEEHDRNMILGNPGLPFLHVTRKWGTHLEFLRPLADYPAQGETVKFLFGYVNRARILEQIETWPRIFGHDTDTGKYGVDYLFFTYYDPARAQLQTVTRAAALAITRDYAATVNRAWHNPAQVA